MIKKVYGSLELIVNICVLGKMRIAALSIGKPAFLAQLCCARSFSYFRFLLIVKFTIKLPNIKQFIPLVTYLPIPRGEMVGSQKSNYSIILFFYFLVPSYITGFNNYYFCTILPILYQLIQEHLFKMVSAGHLIITIF